MIDNTPPAVSCPAATIASANASCQATVPNVLGDVTVSDNCTPAGSLTKTQSPAAGTLVGLGAHTITVMVTDAANNSSACTTTFTVVDATPPALTLNGANPMTIECHGSFTDPGATANDACAGNLTSAITVSGTVNANAVGSYTLNYSVSDGANTASATRTVNVVDTTPPSITAPPNVSASTGVGATTCGVVISDAALGAATASDSCSGVTVTRSGTPTGNFFNVGVTTITYTARDANGNTATATDAMGNRASCQQQITVTNPNPTVTITGPATGSVYAVGSSVNFTGTFTDNAGGAHTATWSFDDLSQPGTVNEATGQVSASYTFTAAGVYQVKLAVSDGCGGTGLADVIGPDSLTMLVVIYDPSAGWVTGGGWINSPAGAYVPNPSLTGKANFGFVSKYQNGQSVPTGNTEFHFKAGDLKFKSTSYEWMVISGGKKAQYKGFGTINGGGNYRFMLTCIDGDQPGGGGQDKFRIRIWSDGGGLVYDNQMNAPDSDDPTTVLGGGSIVIHK